MNNRNQKALRLSVVCAVLVGLLLTRIPPQHTQAQEDILYKRLEISFVMDMPDEDAASSVRDSLQFKSLDLILDQLGSFRAVNAMSGTDLEIAVSVVGILDRQISPITFGDGENWAYLTPATLDEWQAQHQALVNNILQQMTFETIIYTDWRAGFGAAIDNFETVPSNTPLSNSERMQAIVLLSDDTPCALDRPEWAGTCSGSEANPWIEGHLAGLVEDIKADFANPVNQQVYLVGLDITGLEDVRWNLRPDLLDQITKQAATENASATPLSQFDRVIRIESAAEITPMISPMVADLAREMMRGGQQVIAPLGETIAASDARETFEIVPFQDLMTISLFKTRPDTELFLVTPGGQRIQRSGADQVLGEDSLLEIWEINQPQPGPWTFGAQYTDSNSLQWSDPRAAVIIDLRQATFATSYEGVQQQFQPMTAVLAVTDHSGNPLRSYEDEKYELRGTVRVIPPSGATNAFDLALSREDQGRYTVSFTPVESGVYTFQTTVNAGQNNDVTFTAQETPQIGKTAFKVLNIEPVVLQNKTQTYTLQIQDENQQDITSEFTVTQFALKFVPIDSGTCLEPGNDSLEETGNSVTTLQREFTEPDMEYNVCLTVQLADHTSPTQDSIMIRESAPQGTTMVNKVLALALSLLEPIPAWAADDPVTHTIDERDTMPDRVEFTLDDVPFLENQRLPGLYWPQNRVTVQVQVKNAMSQEPDYAVRGLLDELDQTANFFTLRILDRDNNNREMAEGVLLEPTGDQSIWSAEVPELGPGHFTIIVETEHTQKIGDSDYAFQPELSAIQQELVIKPNVYPDAIQWGIVAAALTFAFYLLAIRGTRRFRARIGTAEGFLTILHELDNGQLAQVGQPLDMTKFKRNQFEYNLAEIPLVDPPLTGLKVRSNLRLRRANAVRIDLEVNGKPKLIKQLVGGGTPEPIYTNQSGTRYYLAKDWKQSSQHLSNDN